MRGNIHIAILLFLVAAVGFSQSKNPNFKISNFSSEMRNISGTNGYWLDGFDFNGYNAAYPTLRQMTDAEVKAVKNGTRVSKPTGPYTIIGYSQGGLRALAYATALKSNYPSDFKNLQSVITISGINQGIQALANDLPGVRSRILDEVRIIERGIDSIAYMSIFTQLPLLTTKVITEVTHFIFTGKTFTQAFNNGVLNFVAAFLPEDFNGYVSPALRYPSQTAEKLQLQQLVEMKPGSQYIKDYVASTTTKSYSVRDGSQLVAEVRYKTVFFARIPYIWIGYVPKYKTVKVAEPVYRFDANLPLGFIVGTKNKFDSTPTSVKNLASNLANACAVARTVHIVKSYLIYGIILGCPVYASWAGDAKYLLSDTDNMVKHITQSYDGDGLVARANQYFPRSFYNPVTKTTKTLLYNVYESPDRKGYGYVPVNANHAESDNSSETKRHITNIVAWGKNIRR
jgi:hypothetical protein